MVQSALDGISKAGGQEGKQEEVLKETLIDVPRRGDCTFCKGASNVHCVCGCTFRGQWILQRSKKPGAGIKRGQGEAFAGHFYCVLSGGKA